MYLEGYEYTHRGEVSKNRGRAYLKLSSPLTDASKQEVIKKIMEILGVKKSDILVDEKVIAIEPLVGRFQKKKIEELREELKKILGDIEDIQQEE